MSTGDATDIQARTHGTLPPWWGDTAPVLDSIIAGWGSSGVFVYSLYSYAKMQTRISTASDDWLDLVAYDFTQFGVTRKTGESDASFRARIFAYIVRRLVTRPAIAAALEALTGFAPVIVEPWRPADCGGYNMAGFGYNVAGYWGSQIHPCQSFIRQKIAAPVQASDVYNLISASKAEGTRVWVQITS